MRYRLVLRRLKHNLPAYRSQMLVYRSHLKKQYSDRCEYWKTRGESRLGEKSDGIRVVACTVDSMDHSKFAVPRAAAMAAKTFGQFIRPCLGCTMILLHGFAALVYVSEPHLAHDSSWTCDIVSHALHILKSQFPSIDVRKTHFSCHGDNSSKELKNNSLLRLLSACVSQRRLYSVSLSTLMSGHSHEDIDQCFSSLATWIASQPELHTTDAFCATIQEWLNQPSTRPHESFRQCYRVDQVRAWTL